MPRRTRCKNTRPEEFHHEINYPICNALNNPGEECWRCRLDKLALAELVKVREMIRKGAIFKADSLPAGRRAVWANIDGWIGDDKGMSWCANSSSLEVINK